MQRLVSSCRKLSNGCLQVAELLQHTNLRQYQATWAAVQPLNTTNILCCVQAGSLKQGKRLSDIRSDVWLLSASAGSYHTRSCVTSACKQVGVTLQLSCSVAP